MSVDHELEASLDQADRAKAKRKAKTEDPGAQWNLDFKDSKRSR